MTSVGLADLASFAFTMDLSATPDGTSSFTYAPSDLTSFSAVLGPGSSVSDLSLTTWGVGGSTPGSFPQMFTVESLAPGGAFTTTLVPVETPPLQLESSGGSVTIRAVGNPPGVPEPAALGSLGIGVGGLLIFLRRRRHVAA